MPSTATQHLQTLLQDAAELSTAHRSLRTGQRGRQWGLGALNRATVVLCVSAWEAYVEGIAREGIDALMPVGASAAAWGAVTTPALAQIKRFNTPDAAQTKQLLKTCVGVDDVSAAWAWQKCNTQSCINYLNAVLLLRHQIAHGVNPRPVVHNSYATWLPGFFRNLARCTDGAVSAHIQTLTGRAPW
jgi:hypothetical protein